MSELARIMSVAIDLAEAASVEALKTWQADAEVTYKTDGSSLTKADLSIETLWRDMIHERFPAHSVLGEEFGRETGTSGYTWVLDPIDGTRQFASGLLNYASLISVCQDNTPVIGIIDLPVPGLRYAATTGEGTHFAGRPVRTSQQENLDEAVISLANPDSFNAQSQKGYNRLRSLGKTRVFDGGSPAYGALSRGAIDVCLNGDDLDAYDICALCPVVQESGGTITDWRGQPLTLESSGAIIASASRELHARCLDILADDA
jgi:histidinol phosphatase-like enzyme (inositol monophosphatase family)